MNEPWEQDNIVGLGDDDFAEGTDDEEAELGVDFHSPAEPVEDTRPRRALPALMPARQRIPNPRVAQRGQKFRIRVMGAQLQRKFPGVTSILLTRQDGSQVLLVRKES